MDQIRPYTPSDRSAVRHLAYETAERGGRSTFPDPRLQMDLLTRYYTDHEAGSLWIYERDGQVAGYLTGTINTNKFLSWLQFRGHLLTAFHLIFRNFHRPAVWRWARARIRTLREGGAHREPWISEYPAHLHINLAKEARGAGAGGQLLQTFIAQCLAAKVPGIHLATRADNAEAQKFFQKHGFAEVATINAYKPGTNGLESVPVVIMGKKL